MLLRTFDNKFDCINPEEVRSYNKYHISKTVSDYVVGVDIVHSLENGSIAIKIF